MTEKKSLIITFIVVVLVIAIGAVVYYSIGQTSKDLVLRVGAVEDVNVQSPHPYPNGTSARSLVWTETINHPGATSLRLHFNKFEVKGISNIPTIFEEVDHGRCILIAPEGYRRELIDPNTIRETQIITQQPGEVSVGSARLLKCGIVREKKQFSPQEVFDQVYVKGDFVAIKNKSGKVLDILMRESLSTFNGSPVEFLREDVWGQTYADVDTIIIELYADESDNGFGLYVDKYARGFTAEERERVNQETTDQYLQDCERRGIPPEQCVIPK